jgi:hypothetical protein
MAKFRQAFDGFIIEFIDEESDAIRIEPFLIIKESDYPPHSTEEQLSTENIEQVLRKSDYF